MNKNMGETKSLNVVRIPASLFLQFKMDVLKKNKTIREAIIFLMEAYVETDNPGDGSKKKIDNPGDGSRSPEEILVDKIIEARKAQEDLKEPEIEVHSVEKTDEIQTTKKPVENPEIEPVDESLEVNIVEDLDEIQPEKNVITDPKSKKNPPESELGEEPVDESAAEKNPGPESELVKEPEIEPEIEENPGDEKENDEYEFSHPDDVFPFNLLRRKKQKKEKKL